MQFARGGEALVSFVTGARHDPGWTISAYGQMGSLIVNSGQLVGMRDGDREMALLPIPKRLELGDNPRDPLMWSMVKLVERMVAKINGARDAKPFPDFRDGVAAAQIIDAVRRASDECAWVNVT
jgi:predicted dehydrogenase